MTSPRTYLDRLKASWAFQIQAEFSVHAEAARERTNYLSRLIPTTMPLKSLPKSLETYYAHLSQDRAAHAQKGAAWT